MVGVSMLRRPGVPVRAVGFNVIGHGKYRPCQELRVAEYVITSNAAPHNMHFSWLLFRAIVERRAHPIPFIPCHLKDTHMALYALYPQAWTKRRASARVKHHLRHRLAEFPPLGRSQREVLAHELRELLMRRHRVRTPPPHGSRS